MEFFPRLLDKLDWLVAGLIGVIVARWWRKDDLKDVWSWAIFLITGIVWDRFTVT